jgi:hypothetical protein
MEKMQDESHHSHAIAWFSQVSCGECGASRGDWCEEADGAEAAAEWNERASLTGEPPAMESPSEETLAAVRRGLAQAARGELHDLGSFASVEQPIPTEGEQE